MAWTGSVAAMAWTGSDAVVRLVDGADSRATAHGERLGAHGGRGREREGDNKALCAGFVV